MVEALRAGECAWVCTDKSEPNNFEGVRDVGGRQCNCAGGRGAGDCAGVGYGVAAYVVSDNGDEAFGGGDCGFAGHETEIHDDDGGSVAGASVRSRSPGVVEGG